MKYILPILISFVVCVPVKAGEIYQSIEESQETEYHDMIMDKQGRVRDQISKVTEYFYLNNNGEKVKKDYKIKNLPDNRSLDKKLPPVKLIRMIFNHIQIVLPI